MNDHPTPTDHSNAWKWYQFGCGLTFTHFYLVCKQQFASQFSYHCNSIIFQHYVMCDTSRIKCWMCRWGTIAQNTYFLSKWSISRLLLFHKIRWWPCTCWYLDIVSVDFTISTALTYPQIQSSFVMNWTALSRPANVISSSSMWISPIRWHILIIKKYLGEKKYLIGPPSYMKYQERAALDRLVLDPVWLPDQDAAHAVLPGAARPLQGGHHRQVRHLSQIFIAKNPWMELFKFDIDTLKSTP